MLEAYVLVGLADTNMSDVIEAHVDCPKSGLLETRHKEPATGSLSSVALSSSVG